MLEVALIGGGLAGLSLAQQLFAAGIHFQLFEARQRFAGRFLIQHHRGSCAVSNFPEEHDPRPEYIHQTIEQVGRQWRDVAIAVNAFTLEGNQAACADRAITNRTKGDGGISLTPFAAEGIR